MNQRELVDHIRNGPAKLVLNKRLRFHRRTWFNGRFNPCDFDQFLQALRSSETIRDVRCESQLSLGISEDEWVLLVKTIGRIKDIHSLNLDCRAGSEDFHIFQAVAGAVNSAYLLRKLNVFTGSDNVPIDSSGLAALATALREHTGLQEFTWIDLCSRNEL
jgi:hypothetical protein